MYARKGFVQHREQRADQHRLFHRIDRVVRLKRELPGFCEAIEEYINANGKETEQ